MGKITKQEKEELEEKFQTLTQKNAEIYRSGKEKLHSVEIRGLKSDKKKTIKQTTYSNGVVKNRLVRVEKALGGGKTKRIF